MKSLQDRIAAKDALVFDGGMGVALFGKGLNFSACPEACNREHPEWIHEISVDFRNAGADVLQTNTFGASPLRLAAFGLEGLMREINQRGVAIAREAAGPAGYVSASVGPSGQSAVSDAVHESYCRQIEVLRNEGVDALTIETMGGVEEAEIALRAARETAPELPTLVTLVFHETSDGIRTLQDQTTKEVASTLEAGGASCAGSNCGTGIDSMIRIARALSTSTRLPLLIQPSAGLPVEIDGVLSFPDTPAYFESRIPELLDLGVRLIGGCCGTTPEHIRGIRGAIDRRS